MINQNFAILAAVLPIVGGAQYARDTLRGKAKPNRVTWILWTVAPLIAFAAALVEHADLKLSLLTFGVAVGPLLVVIASLMNRKKAFWKLTKFDAVCGSVSLVALLLWAITGQGFVAIVFSILADLAAGVPTLIKSYKFPKTESAGMFILSTIGAGMTLLTIPSGNWQFANYGFTLYVLLMASATGALILCPRQRPPAVISSSQN
jgi:hypothetical protein